MMMEPADKRRVHDPEKTQENSRVQHPRYQYGAKPFFKMGGRQGQIGRTLRIGGKIPEHKGGQDRPPACQPGKKSILLSLDPGDRRQVENSVIEKKYQQHGPRKTK